MAPLQITCQSIYQVHTFCLKDVPSTYCLPQLYTDINLIYTLGLKCVPGTNVLSHIPVWTSMHQVHTSIYSFLSSSGTAFLSFLKCLSVYILTLFECILWVLILLQASRAQPVWLQAIHAPAQHKHIIKSHLNSLFTTAWHHPCSHCWLALPCLWDGTA